MHRLVRRLSREWTFSSSHQQLVTASLPVSTPEDPFVRFFFNSRVKFSSRQRSRQPSRFDTEADTTLLAQLNQILDDNKCNPDIVNRNLYNLLLEEPMIRLAHRNLVAGYQKDFYERPGLVREIANSLLGEKFQFESLPPPKTQEGEKFSYSPPPFRDKVVIEAMRITLENIYEPIFLDSSHGFRPSRNRHTALMSVRRELRHHKRALVGRIDNHEFNPHVLVSLLEQKIGDKRFIRLIWKALKAGHGHRKPHVWTIKNVWEWKHEAMTLSTLLSNIYFHALDCWIRDRKAKFDILPIVDTMNPQVLNLAHRITLLQREGKLARVKVLRARKAQLEGGNKQSLLRVRQLFYVRYADEFMVSCIASKEELLRLQKDLEEFLKQEMKLDIPEGHFKVSRLTGSHAYFLGTKITVSKSPVVGRIRLEAPMDKIIIELAKLGMVSVGGTRPHPVTYLARCTHNEIIAFYNWVMRGCCTYYSFVDNFYQLTSYMRLAIRSSCVRTLTMKLKRRRSARTYKEFGTECAARYRAPVRNGSVVDAQLSEEERALLKERMKAAKRLRLDWDDLGSIEQSLLQRFIIPKRIQEPNGDINLEFRGDYLLFCGKTTEHEETKRAKRKLELLPTAQNIWDFKEILVPPPRPRLSVDYESLYPH